MKLKLDENLPAELCLDLRGAGHEADSVVLAAWSGSRPRDPDPATAHGDDGSIRKLPAMTTQDLLHDLDSSLRGHIGKADKTGVRLQLDIQDFPEVLVEGNKHSPTLIGPIEENTIARVWPQIL